MGLARDGDRLAGVAASRSPESASRERRGLAFTPGWAVGWWFVPFANLVKPFQSIRELWKASSADRAWPEIRTWPVIGWWWGSRAGAFLVAALVGLVAGVRSDDPISIESHIFLDQLGLALAVSSIASAILAILIVRSVVTRQKDLRIPVVEIATPPPRPDRPRLGS
jgi:hypothetical protein